MLKASFRGYHLSRIGNVDAFVLARIGAAKHFPVEDGEPVELRRNIGAVAKVDPLAAYLGFQLEAVAGKNDDLRDLGRPKAIPSDKIGEPEDVPCQGAIAAMQHDLRGRIAREYWQLDREPVGERKLHTAAVDIATAAIAGKDPGDGLSFGDPHL